MNIYKKTVQFCRDQHIAILIGLSGGIVGCVVGGQINQYQAHFQQRRVVAIPEIVTEQMRPAAPEMLQEFVVPDEPEKISYATASEESSLAESSAPESSAPPESSPAVLTVPESRPHLEVPLETRIAQEMSSAPSSMTPSEQSSSFSSMHVSRSDDSGIVAPEGGAASSPHSPASASASASAITQAPAPASPAENFPPMGNAVHPVASVPNWGAMRTPDQWNRTYAQMRENDFVSIPRYIASEQTLPMAQLRQTRTPENERLMTAKLYYSTDYCGSYDLDAGQFTGPHCGLDLKLPLGTPVGSVAGGRVQYVGSDALFGLHVIVEHHSADGVFFSIYAHLGAASVRAGQDVTAGQVIGTVGMTGETSAPHVHFQIDRKQNGEAAPHQPYVTEGVASPATAAQFTINPIEFVQKY